MIKLLKIFTGRYLSFQDYSGRFYFIAQSCFVATVMLFTLRPELRNEIKMYLLKQVHTFCFPLSGLF